MVQLDVTGMTCGHCQNAVRNALESVEGVQKADVNLNSGVARITGDADADKLVRAVEEEGYGASVAS